MKIAVGNSRMDKKWKNRDISWEDLCQRVSSTIRTTETVEEYRKLKKGAQDNIKDVGGFVGGQLREGRRKNGMVLCRSMLTLDMDYGEPGIWDEIDLLHDFRCCVYSTHKHTPEHPRLRMIIPLARDITEEEYPAVARMVAKEIGIDLFDDTTYEACRLMYWPSTSANGEFFYKTKEGPLLDPDAYLAKYADWHDASTWPVSSRQSEAVRRSITQQADPLEKPGIVGAFCRAYTIEEAIEAFLSDVYEPSSMNGRYDYIPADSAAGVVVYDGKFAYSHHATDPVCGKLLNAFDLVRLHKFRELDENVGLDTPPGKLPSFKAMSDLALGDDKVKAVFAGERIAQAAAEFSEEDWQNGLELDKSGHVKNTLRNLTLILENDPNLKGVVFNQLLDGMEIKGEVPWNHPSKFWRDADDAQLISYVDAHYGTFSARNYDIAVTKVADDRAYRDILAGCHPPDHRDGHPASDLAGGGSAGHHHRHCRSHPADHRGDHHSRIKLHPADHPGWYRPAGVAHPGAAPDHYHHRGGYPADHHRHRERPHQQHPSNHPGGCRTAGVPDCESPDHHCGDREGDSADHHGDRLGSRPGRLPDCRGGRQPGARPVAGHPISGRMDLGQGVRLDLWHLGWNLQLLRHQFSFKRDGLGGRNVSRGSCRGH